MPLLLTENKNNKTIFSDILFTNPVLDLHIYFVSINFYFVISNEKDIFFMYELKTYKYQR